MAGSTATTARVRGTLGALREGVTAASRTPYGWAPAVVLFLVSLVDRVEFSLVAAVLPQLQDEWGFSDTVGGSIPAASAIVAALLAVPSGYLADRADRTRIVAGVVFLWAVATLASGLVAGFAAFYAVRMFLAAAEAIDNPSAGSLLADYYPPVTRATAYGWWRTSAYLGGLGLALGGAIAHLAGWRAVFLVMSVPGVLVAWLAWRLREPERGFVDRLVAGAEPGAPQHVAASAVAERSLRAQLGDVLRIPTLWYTGSSLTIMSLAIAGLYYWIPSLLQRRFDLDEAAAGGISGLLSLVGVVGGTVVGARLGARPRGGLTLAPWRVLVGGAGILLNGVLMAAALASPAVGGLALLLLLSAFFGAWAIPTLTACVADVIPAADRGCGFGVLQVGATAGAALGPLIVGVVSDATGSLLTGMAWLVPLLLAGGVAALAARTSVERDAAAVLTAARH